MAKRKHYSEEEIIRILKKAEFDMPVSELLRQHLTRNLLSLEA